jgi:Pectinacetylesterase
MGDNRLVAQRARALLATLVLLAAAGCSGGGDDEQTTAAPAAEPEPRWVRLQPGGETSCARGGIYSFWVRRADPAKLVIFFQGGGGCWNAETCAPGSEWFDDAVDEGDNPLYQRGIFDFDRPENPFRDWSFVFIPYCTGDLHTGTREFDWGVFTVRHFGRTNAEAALTRTFERFRDPRQVLVTGCSAGSVGAAVHAARVLATYRRADVAVLGDSLTLPFARPLDLSAAGGPRGFSPESVVRGLAEDHPQATLARFNYAADAVQQRFDTAIQPSRTPFEQRLRASETRLKGLPNYRSYLACGTEHCVLPDEAFYSLTVDGARIRDWTADLAAGEDVACPTCRGR